MFKNVFVFVLFFLLHAAHNVFVCYLIEILWNDLITFGHNYVKRGGADEMHHMRPKYKQKKKTKQEREL